MDTLLPAITGAFARARSEAFVARELALAWLARTPPLRILFSNREGWVAQLERKFGFTRHRVTFGDIRSEDLDRYDLVVPLSMEDLRYLSALGPAFHSRIPVPHPETIELCDDKVAFRAHLAARGFAHWLPRSGSAVTRPYVLKAIHDEAGAHCHMVTSAEAEREVAALRARPDYFTEEFVPGRREYASHILFLDGRIVHALCVEYDYHVDYPIKGRNWPDYMMLRGCPYLALFARMLEALRYEGLCCVNFKLRDGEPLVFEINPRLGRSATDYFFAFLRHLPAR